MRKFLYPMFCLLVLMVPVALSAQKTGVEVSPDDPFAFRKAMCTFNKIPLPKGDVTVTVPAYLKENNENLHGTQSNLVLQYDKTSPGGRHLTFQQMYAGIAVFNSQVKVTIDNHNNIDCIVDNSYYTGNWGLFGLEQTAIKMQQHDNIAKFQEAHPQAGIIARNTIVISVLNNQPAVYRMVETFNENAGTNVRYLLDENGKSVYDHDLNRYSGITHAAKADGITTTGSAKPFVPDPLTKAGKYYDPATPWDNHGDTDIVELNAQRVAENVDVTFDLLSSSYSLKNSRVEILDFSAPNIAPPTSSTPVFEFTRHQDAFEAANAFYNINAHNAHLTAIGFDSLANFYIRVDVHALSGADNSQFSDGTNIPSLYFGDGGVQDAEDADVVVHEYSHGVSNNASPNTNNGQERSSLDEGMADYFATSYSRSLYEFRWADMFTWDGHNEFWPGRTAASSQHYPQDLSSSIHSNGQMWCSSLMQIWGYLGRTTTDRLMLQTLYSFADNITFTDAAKMFLHSDSLLNGGANACLISTIFYNRGFFDSTQLPATCKLIGIENQQPAQLLKVVNTDGFAYRNEPVMVENNGLDNLQKIDLFDVTGKLLQSSDNLKERITYLSGDGLAKGVYLLRVYTHDQYTTFKLVKAID